MDVEFLGPDGTPMPPAEELLDTGPPRRPRRRLILLLVIGGAALLVAGLLASVLSDGGGSPSAGPTHPAVISRQPPPGLSVAINVPTDSPAVELDGNVILELGGRLWWLSLDGTFSDYTSIDDADGYQLVADPARHQVWVLLTGSASEVVLVDSDATRSPAQQADFRISAQLAGGALLDGRFYVTTDRGVGSLNDQDGSVSWTPVRGGWSVTADPTRHRLLLVDLDGDHASVRAQRPSDPRPEAQATLPFSKGWVVVAGDQIWAAGYGDHGAVLDRLDPKTLRVVARSPVAAQLGPGAIVVGAGLQALLVRSGSGGDGLWCVDAHTGGLAATWSSVPGGVALGLDGGYQIASTTGPPQLLTGNICRP